MTIPPRVPATDDHGAKVEAPPTDAFFEARGGALIRAALPETARARLAARLQG